MALIYSIVSIKNIRVNKFENMLVKKQLLGMKNNPHLIVKIIMIFLSKFGIFVG